MSMLVNISFSFCLELPLDVEFCNINLATRPFVDTCNIGSFQKDRHMQSF